MKVIFKNTQLVFKTQGPTMLTGTLENGTVTTAGTISGNAGFYFTQFDLSEVRGGFIKVTTTVNNQYIGLASLFAKTPSTDLTVYDVLNSGAMNNTKDVKTQVFDMSQYPTAKFLCMGNGQSTTLQTAEWRPTNDF